MNVAAGIVGIFFGLLHGAPSASRLGAPQAARGSGDTAAIPMWARLLWLTLSVATVIGGVLLLAGDAVVGAIIVSAGALGLLFLAVANGFWIHGSPTWSHHVVRGVFVIAILVLAILSATK